MPLPIFKRVACAACLSLISVTSSHAAPVKSTIHHFTGSPGGYQPQTPLLKDERGNLYGTTVYGGTKNDEGTVFRLVPQTNSTSWNLEVLHSFVYRFGRAPTGKLVRTPDGQLFGATMVGGANGRGVAYSLTPPAVSGTTPWTYKKIWDFAAYESWRPQQPEGGLTIGPDGDLYGSSFLGGSYGFGTIFRLVRPAAGATAWTIQTIRTFNEPIGTYPRGSVVFDAAGTLYATAVSAGRYGRGISFSLTPHTAGQTPWSFKALAAHGGGQTSFDPFTDLLIGENGELFGTNLRGGPAGYGAVFRLSPPTPGKTTWTSTEIYTFKGGTDGRHPYNGVTRAADGSLFGATYIGGKYGHGQVFKLVPPPTGKTTWSKMAVYDFRGGADGSRPFAKLLIDESGVIYGTTTAGGRFDRGTVFKIVP